MGRGGTAADGADSAPCSAEGWHSVRATPPRAPRAAPARATSPVGPHRSRTQPMTLTNPGGRASGMGAASPSLDGPAELEIRDGRTAREYRIPVEDSAIRARDLGQVHVAD